MKKILQFKNEYEFLSNFYEARTEYEGVVYPTSEHAYQAAKSKDATTRYVISKLETPDEAKKMGNIIKIRDDWDEIKTQVMYDCLVSKFSDKKLAKKLLATGDKELIEGNHHSDMFWGKVDGVGYNMLGRILMRIRSELRVFQTEDNSKYMLVRVREVREKIALVDVSKKCNTITDTRRRVKEAYDNGLITFDDCDPKIVTANVLNTSPQTIYNDEKYEYKIIEVE